MAWVGVPGLGLTDPTLAGVLERLGPWRVERLPGYGRRAPRRVPVDPPAVAAALTARLRDLPGPLALVSHSSSCQVVAETALLLGDRVVAVVMVGPTTDPRAATWPRLVARWLATAAHEPLGQVPLLVRSYSRTGPLSMARAMGASRRHDLLRAVRRLPCPLLVTRGRDDRIAPGDWVATVAAEAPDGRSADLPRGAHMPPVTHPAVVARAVRDAFPTLVGG